MKTTTRATETAEPTKAAPAQTAPPTQGTRELLANILAAASDDDALKLAAPAAPRQTKADSTYEVVPSENPLPKRGGLSVQVYVIAARLRKPFKLADIEAALPGKKSVRYWIRALAKDGHFRVVAA